MTISLFVLSVNNGILSLSETLFYTIAMLFRIFVNVEISQFQNGFEKQASNILSSKILTF